MLWKGEKEVSKVYRDEKKKIYIFSALASAHSETFSVSIIHYPLRSFTKQKQSQEVCITPNTLQGQVKQIVKMTCLFVRFERRTHLLCKKSVAAHLRFAKWLLNEGISDLDAK